MIRVGLTGGIGSGKTTVARILENMHYPVYIADSRASRLTGTDPGIRTALTEAFGTGIYKEDRTLDKSRLASIIFNDKAALQKVNGIVHPAVLKDFKDWAAHQSVSPVFFESAIIFEAHLEKQFDYIICVSASPEVRLERVMKRDKVSAESIKKRMSHQWDDEIKCRKADYIIYTDRDMDLQGQIQTILQTLH